MILVFGAAGSGTTTVGRALASRLGWSHVDLDAVLWEPSDPPYRVQRPPEARRAMLDGIAGPWVASGSPGRWTPEPDLAVYLEVPTEVRIARLQQREAERWGARITGDLHAQHLAFLEWAAAYDVGPREGRSRAAHERWMVGRNVLRLDGTRRVEELVEAIGAHRAVSGSPCHAAHRRT